MSVDSLMNYSDRLKVLGLPGFEKYDNFGSFDKLLHGCLALYLEDFATLPVHSGLFKINSSNGQVY